MWAIKGIPEDINIFSHFSAAFKGTVPNTKCYVKYTAPDSKAVPKFELEKDEC